MFTIVLTGPTTTRLSIIVLTIGTTDMVGIIGADMIHGSIVGAILGTATSIILFLIHITIIITLRIPILIVMLGTDPTGRTMCGDNQLIT